MAGLAGNDIPLCAVAQLPCGAQLWKAMSYWCCLGNYGQEGLRRFLPCRKCGCPTHLARCRSSAKRRCFHRWDAGALAGELSPRRIALPVARARPVRRHGRGILLGGARISGGRRTCGAWVDLLKGTNGGPVKRGGCLTGPWTLSRPRVHLPSSSCLPIARTLLMGR